MEPALYYPFLPQKLIDAAGNHLASQETLLAFLRENGLSKSESMIALSELMHMDPDDAKEAVHFSPVWQSSRNIDETYMDAAIGAATLRRAAGPSRGPGRH